MNNDLISREALRNEVDTWGCNDYDKYDFLEAIDNAPTVELDESIIQEVLNKRCMTAVANEYLIALHGNSKKPKDEWIPIKYRPLTGEERVKFSEYWGIEYCDTLSEVAFDCPMPEDGQRILISTKYGVDIDTCSFDPDEGYALEDRGDWDGVEAWMSLPNSYKRSDEE